MDHQHFIWRYTGDGTWHSGSGVTVRRWAADGITYHLHWSSLIEYCLPLRCYFRSAGLGGRGSFLTEL